MNTVKDIAYAGSENRQQTLDLYLPCKKGFSTLAYFHGGGLESGSKEKDIDSLIKLTDKSIALASVDYRLYPFAQFPDFIRDGASSLAWLKEHIREYGGCETVYVAGSSAGGYIAMMLYFDRRFLAPFHLTPLDFAGFIFDAGQPTTHFNVLRERGEDTRRVVVDNAAPLYHVKNYDNEPRVLVVMSDNDMPNRSEQTQLLLSTMECFGYPKESITFEIMEDSEHCSYCSQPVFAQTIFNFMEKRN